ncbi:MAG: GTP 3',8-cyclase MoaA [Spirochaetaceae bacterium]|jgi:cyclic pyranopterin phosphate synthase|nr:GTP 3',8-cyclase MoaA [Spirochaetaceae bacterium]
MQDGFGRTIDYLRVSVTDKCNLRCIYCMPPGGVEWVPHREMLTFEELLRICASAAGLGISKVKVTGGEPLVRRGLTGFIRALKRTEGIGSVTLTTNALVLGDFLEELTGAGIDAVNVSLDTLNEDVFRYITRTDGFGKVMRSVNMVREAGIPLKINCVPMRGVNEDDIVPLAEFARHERTAVRFIELMPLGPGANMEAVSEAEIFELLRRAFGELRPFDGRLGNGPASYYSAAGFAGKIGFISAVSHGFCGACNRLRLTGAGLLRPCLASDAAVDMKAVLRGGGDEGAIAGALRTAAMLKPVRHDFHQTDGYNKRHGKKNMSGIGG